VNTQQKVEAAHDRLFRANQAKSAARKALEAVNWTRPSAEYDTFRAASRAREMADSEMQIVRTAASAEFAAERGWKFAKHFKVAELRRGRRGGGKGTGRYYRYTADSATRRDAGALDHMEFLTLDRKPVAIITHSYNSFAQVAEFARSEGLLAEELPYSWYYPGGTVAVVLTAAPQEQREVSHEHPSR
jgi:hypothetical protein